MQVDDRSLMLGRTTDYGRNLNDPYDLPFLEHAEEIDAEARVPFTELRYRYEGLPVEVSMEAFSPFIPLDAKNSALPIAFFTFTVANRTAAPVRAALFMAQRNLVGYSERERKSTMAFTAADGCARITFGREGLEQDCPSRGGMCVGAWADAPAAFSHVLHARSNRDIWEPLRAAGRLEDADWSEVRTWDHLPYGVLCCSVELAPRETRRVTFALAWHFPEMWERPYEPKQQPAHRLGHRYATWFADADAVLDYAVANYGTLRRESLRFVDDFYASTLPRWLLNAVNAQLTTLVKASWWDEAGRFGIWEGLGCCGLQTTDITHYASFPIVQMFPDLQKSQMRLSAANFEGKGQVPHLMPGSFCCSDRDERKRIDLIPQFVLLVWRDALWTADAAYAREMWPFVRDAVEYASTFDTDGDGLPNNQGPDQTYDQFPLKGTSAFVGLLYGASLHAAAEVARMAGEADAAGDLDRRHADAMRLLREQLWNGSYYRLCYDPADGDANEGVMADQVNADWFVRQTTGRGLLPDEEVRSALGAVLEHCSKGGYLANCAWPTGERRRHPAHDGQPGRLGLERRRVHRGRTPRPARHGRAGARRRPRRLRPPRAPGLPLQPRRVRPALLPRAERLGPLPGAERLQHGRHERRAGPACAGRAGRDVRALHADRLGRGERLRRGRAGGGNGAGRRDRGAVAAVARRADGRVRTEVRWREGRLHVRGGGRRRARGRERGSCAMAGGGRLVLRPAGRRYGWPLKFTFPNALLVLLPRLLPLRTTRWTVPTGSVRGGRRGAWGGRRGGHAEAGDDVPAARHPAGEYEVNCKKRQNQHQENEDVFHRTSAPQSARGTVSLPYKAF